MQYLGDPLLELLGGDDLVMLQIFKLSLCKVFPELRPCSLNGIEVSTVRRESESSEPILVVLTIYFEKPFVVHPHLQPFAPRALME